MSAEGVHQSLLAIAIRTGHLDPDVITQEMGIQPTESWRAGAVREGKRTPTPWGMWRLAVRGEAEGVRDLFRRLLDQVEPRRALLARYGRSPDLDVSCWLTLWMDMDGSLQFGLPADLIGRLGDVCPDLVITVVAGEGGEDGGVG